MSVPEKSIPSSWWARAQALGLLPAGATPPASAPSPSWVVLGLSFIGAQLVLWPLLGSLWAVLGELVLHGAGAALVSVVLAMAGLWLQRHSLLVFVDQLGFSLLLAAQVLWLLAGVLWLDAPWWLVVLSLLLQQLLLLWCCPTPWVQRLLGLQASWSLLTLPSWSWWLGASSSSNTVEWMLNHWPQHVLPLALLWALWAHQQGRWLTLRRAATLQALADGAVVGLLLALAVGSGLWKRMLGWEAPGSADAAQAGQAVLWSLGWGTAVQVAVVLLSAWWLQRRWQVQGHARHLLGLVYLAAALACWGVPHMGSITLVATVAAATARWRTLWLAGLVLLLELGHFYYALQWPLQDKALALALLGAGMALAVWWLRVPADRADHADHPDGPATAAPGLPPRVTALVVLATAMVALGLVHHDARRKETVLLQGQQVFMPLMPRDPRSLLQGDYMALRFAYPETVHAALQQQPATTRRVLALAELDARGVAHIVRLALPDEQPAAGHVLLPLQRLKGEWVVVTDAFFFPEGQGQPLAAAQFGVFRLLPDGQALLAGLADADLRPVQPAPVPADAVQADEALSDPK